jgi:hypothetical protein
MENREAAGAADAHADRVISADNMANGTFWDFITLSYLAPDPADTGGSRWI